MKSSFSLDGTLKAFACDRLSLEAILFTFNERFGEFAWKESNLQIHPNLALTSGSRSHLLPRLRLIESRSWLRGFMYDHAILHFVVGVLVYYRAYLLYEYSAKDKSEQKR